MKESNPTETTIGVELEGGKYTVIQSKSGVLIAYRYNDVWRDLTGDKLVLAMLHEIKQLREENKALAQDLSTALTSIP